MKTIREDIVYLVEFLSGNDWWWNGKQYPTIAQARSALRQIIGTQQTINSRIVLVETIFKLVE